MLVIVSKLVLFFPALLHTVAGSPWIPMRKKQVFHRNQALRGVLRLLFAIPKACLALSEGMLRFSGDFDI